MIANMTVVIPLSSANPFSAAKRLWIITNYVHRRIGGSELYMVYRRKVDLEGILAGKDSYNVLQRPSAIARHRRRKTMA